MPRFLFTFFFIVCSYSSWGQLEKERREMHEEYLESIEKRRLLSEYFEAVDYAYFYEDNYDWMKNLVKAEFELGKLDDFKKHYPILVEHELHPNPMDSVVDVSHYNQINFLFDLADYPYSEWSRILKMNDVLLEFYAHDPTLKHPFLLLKIQGQHLLRTDDLMEVLTEYRAVYPVNEKVEHVFNESLRNKLYDQNDFVGYREFTFRLYAETKERAYYIDAVRSYLDDDDYEGALKHQDAIEDSSFVVLYEILGKAHAALGDSVKAKKYYDAFMKKMEDHSDYGDYSIAIEENHFYTFYPIQLEPIAAFYAEVDSPYACQIYSWMNDFYERSGDNDNSSYMSWLKNIVIAHEPGTDEMKLVYNEYKNFIKESEEIAREAQDYINDFCE